MACFLRKANLLWAGNRFEIIGKYAASKQQLEVIATVHFSDSSLGIKHDRDYHKQMWKRLKKNDPEMDLFLSAAHTKSRIHDLAKAMGCSTEEATELVKRDSPLGVTDGDNLLERIKLLKTSKFSSEDIIANPAVLHRKSQVLQHRLAALKMLKHPANQMSLSILKKSDRDFKIYVEKCLEEQQFLSSYSTRQNCLASLLDCNIKEAKEMIDEHGLDSVSPVLLKNKIDVLKHFQISNDVIKDNIRILVNASVPVLENRLQMLKDNNLLDWCELKLGYLLSCKIDDFEKSVALSQTNRKALEGCMNKKEYLIFHLQCSDRAAEGLVTRKPISSMSEVKLQKMVDFFLNDMKVSSDFVISNVYLMGFSVERMQRRWPIICSAYEGTEWLPRLLSMPDADFDKLVSGAHTRQD